MRRIGAFIIFVFFCFPVAPLNAGEGGGLWEGQIYQSNEDYRKGRYEDAIDGYLALIRMGCDNGHVYYNLGNAYFKHHQPGYAVLNYERARFFLPRDADLNFNLSQCRRLIGEDAADSGHIIGDIFFWLDALTLAESFWGFAVLNALFWPFLMVWLLFKKEWVYYLFLLLVAGWIFSGVSFGLKWYLTVNDHRSVILPAQVDVHAGPFSSDEILFEIFAGGIVFQERAEGGWVLIRTTDNKRGWARKNSMETIRLE